MAPPPSDVGERLRTRLWDAGTRLQTQQDEFASMGGITALAVDEASMDCAVRVYDPLASEVVQVHRGHSDAVRCILHVPEKDQYITASWDHTIRVWRAHAAGRRKGDGAASPTRRGASPTRAAARRRPAAARMRRRSVR